MNYERLVQWLAGPISILGGWLATQIVTHWTIFGNILPPPKQAATAHAIVVVVTFAVGALVTYAAHHKWLDNLAKWWTVNHLPDPAGVLTGSNAEGPPSDFVDPSETGLDHVASVLPDRSGIPHGEGPALSGAAQQLSNSEEFADRPGVTDVTDREVQKPGA